MTPRPRVTALQYRLLHYRVALFEQLRAECDRRAIELRLAHGQPSARESFPGHLAWLAGHVSAAR